MHICIYLCEYIIYKIESYIYIYIHVQIYAYTLTHMYIYIYAYMYRLQRNRQIVRLLTGCMRNNVHTHISQAQVAGVYEL